MYPAFTELSRVELTLYTDSLTTAAGCGPGSIA